jgi:hypothetical protein
MKPEFHEDFQNPHNDPLDSQQADFDWDAVCERLGEELNREDKEKLALALRRIFQWVLDFEYDIKASPLMPDTLIGRRLVALAWVVNPDLFPGSPSLRRLSRHLGITAPIMAELTGEVCREFGIQNRAQDHAWNRKSSFTNAPG